MPVWRSDCHTEMTLASSYSLAVHTTLSCLGDPCAVVASRTPTVGETGPERDQALLKWSNHKFRAESRPNLLYPFVPQIFISSTLGLSDLTNKIQERQLNLNFK